MWFPLCQLLCFLCWSLWAQNQVPTLLVETHLCHTQLRFVQGYDCWLIFKVCAISGLDFFEKKLPVHFKPGGGKLSVILHPQMEGWLHLGTIQCLHTLRIFCHPKGCTLLSFQMFAAFLTCSWSSTLVRASVIWESIPWSAVRENGHFWEILSEAKGFPTMAQLCGALSIQQAQEWWGWHCSPKSSVLNFALSMFARIPNSTTGSQAVCGGHILLAWGQDPIRSLRLRVYLPLFMWENN